MFDRKLEEGAQPVLPFESMTDRQREGAYSICQLPACSPQRQMPAPINPFLQYRF
jgi:hypothetical protein